MVTKELHGQLFGGFSPVISYDGTTGFEFFFSCVQLLALILTVDVVTTVLRSEGPLCVTWAVKPHPGIPAVVLVEPEHFWLLSPSVGQCHGKAAPVGALGKRSMNKGSFLIKLREKSQLSFQYRKPATLCTQFPSCLHQQLFVCSQQYLELEVVCNLRILNVCEYPCCHLTYLQCLI